MPKLTAAARTTAIPTTDPVGASGAPDAVRTTKSAIVIAMLQREEGATLPEIVEATAWQPHTTRAMLTGLRKKGHAIDRGKREDVTCYRLPAANV